MHRVKLVGGAAVGFSLAYFASDLWEALSGGFTTGQLWLTFVAEAALPVFVLGLASVQHLGRLGRLSALAYAYAYLFFTGTVVYALLDGTPDFAGLDRALSPWMTLHGAVMLFAGLGFGLATARAGVLPRWTGFTLMAGVVLVSCSQGLPEAVQLLAAGLRDLGFAGMGVALLRRRDVVPVGRNAAPGPHSLVAT